MSDWIARKLADQEAYRARFSPWDDLKFTLMGGFLLFGPLVLLGFFALVVFVLV